MDVSFLFSEMRWFRGHAEAPRLLSLSPLQADEDLDGASYHFHATSRYRGKNPWESTDTIATRRYKKQDATSTFTIVISRWVEFKSDTVFSQIFFFLGRSNRMNLSDHSFCLLSKAKKLREASLTPWESAFMENYGGLRIGKKLRLIQRINTMGRFENRYIHLGNFMVDFKNIILFEFLVNLG